MGFLKELKRRFTPGYAKEEHDLMKGGYTKEEAEIIIDERKREQRYFDNLSLEEKEAHVKVMDEQIKREEELIRIEEDEEARERGRQKVRRSLKR